MEGAPQPNTDKQSPEGQSPDAGQKESFNHVLRGKLRGLAGIAGIAGRLLGVVNTSTNESPRRSFDEIKATQDDAAAEIAIHAALKDFTVLKVSNTIFSANNDGSVTRRDISVDPVASVVNKNVEELKAVNEKVPTGGPEDRKEGYDPSKPVRARVDGIAGRTQLNAGDTEPMSLTGVRHILDGNPSEDVVHVDHAAHMDINLSTRNMGGFAAEQPVRNGFADTVQPELLNTEVRPNLHGKDFEVTASFMDTPDMGVDKDGFPDTQPPLIGVEVGNADPADIDDGFERTRPPELTDIVEGSLVQSSGHGAQSKIPDGEVAPATDYDTKGMNVDIRRVYDRRHGFGNSTEEDLEFIDAVTEVASENTRRQLADPTYKPISEYVATVTQQVTPEVAKDKKKKNGIFSRIKGFFRRKGNVNEDPTFMDSEYGKSNEVDVDIDLNDSAQEVVAEQVPTVVATQVDSVKVPETLAERARREKWTEADYLLYYAGKSKGAPVENDTSEDKEKPLESAALQEYLDKNKNSGVIIASTPEEVSALFKKETAEYDERRRVEAERLRALGSIEGSSNVEKKPVQKARENLIAHANTVHEKWKEFHPASRLIISTGLIGIGLLTPVGASSALATGAIIAGKAVVRGFNAAELGQLAEGVRRKSMLKKLSEGEVLTEKNEKKLRNTKWAVGLSAFVLGSYTDAMTLYDMAHNAVQGVLHGATDVVISHAPSVPFVDAVASHAPSSAASATQELAVGAVADLYGDTAVEAAKEGTERLGSLGATSVHEALVNKGDSLISIAMRDLLPEVFTPETIITLTTDAKQTFVANIINHLSPDQLQAIGIPGGSEHALQVGQKIDIMKLAEMVKDMTLMVDGKEISLIERAYQMGR